MFAGLLKSINLQIPHSFRGCSPPSSCLLAPEKWWWWELQRCSRRRRGRQRSTPRKRWTFPSGTPGSGPGPHKWSPLSASTRWKRSDKNRWWYKRRDNKPLEICEQVNSLWPSLSGGHSKESKQGPKHVVVVEIVLLPLPLLRFHLVIAFVHQIFAPETKTHSNNSAIRLFS